MKNITISVKKPPWLDRITRLDGSLILAGEATNGIEPLAQDTYIRKIKKNDNSTGSSNK